MENLLAYIPIDRCLALAYGENLPDRTTGAALFADIKGFTPLTEAFAQELGSKRGPEEITLILNRVYGALIDEVHRYHGTVIGFSGDAITCWFDETRAEGGRMKDEERCNQRTSSLRAVSCALAMQRAMQQFSEIKTPGGKVCSVAIKVAVAAGPVRRFVVGDPQVQLIEVLAGQTLEEMTATEKLATKGEVVVSEAVCKHLKGNLQVSEQRSDPLTGLPYALVAGLRLPADPCPWPMAADEILPEEEARPWLHPAVYDRLQSGQGEFLAELRPAVALFVKFAGIDYDNDDDAEKNLNTYICWVQNVLLHYQGVLLQLTIGDKGSYLYAAFGAPMAHDDDTVRAITTALSLLNPPASIQCIRNIQIGLSRGTMRTGAYGSLTRRTYGVLGAQVNLAARLMEAAKPGEILCDNEIVRAASSFLAFETLAPIKVKGRDETIAIYRPLGAKTKTLEMGPKAEIVGRLAERKILSNAVQALRRGEGGIIILEGDTGIGKTMLVDEMRRQADALRLSVMLSSGESVETSTPYYGWRGIFSQLFGLNVLEDPAIQKSRFLDAIKEDSELEQLAPLLNAVLPFELPDNSHTAEMTGQARANSTRYLLVKLLRMATAKAPRMIILDDAHWLDSLSWEFAVHLGYTLVLSGEPLMLVLVSRPLEEGSVGAKNVASLKTLDATRSIQLQPLQPDETVGVAELHLGLARGRLPGPVANLVGQRAEGNPLVAEELAYALRDQGVIRIEPDPQDPQAGLRCELAGDLSQAAQSLPGTIQGLILARIDRLPPERQLTLKVAAVIGRTFSYTPLYYVLQLYTTVNETILRLNLDAMAAMDMTPLYSDEPELMYIFKHIIVHEVAYETLLFAQRRQLHSALVDWYEGTFPGRLEEYASTLAYHCRQAGLEEKALDYLLMAGERARSKYALKEAVDHYLAALEILEGRRVISAANEGEHSQKLMLTHTQLGELLTSTGQYGQARPHLETALSLAASAGDMDGQAEIARWMAYLGQYSSDYPLALEWVQRGLSILNGRQTYEAAELLLCAGMVHMRQGHYDEGLACSQDGLRIAGALGESAALARAYNLLSLIARWQGQSQQTIEYARHAHELYQRTGDLQGQASSNNIIATAYFSMGEWNQAEKYYFEARKSFADMGDLFHAATVENNLGGIALNQGRLDEAWRLYESALHMLQQTGGSRYFLALLQMNLGAVSIRKGEAPAAFQRLKAAQEFFEQSKTRDYLSELNRHLAGAALLAGDLNVASSYSQTALELARELAMRSDEGSALRILGQVTLACGQAEQAAAYLQDSITILHDVNEEYEEARSRLALAALFHQRGEMDAAQTQVDACLPVFERLEACLDITAARQLLT